MFALFSTDPDPAGRDPRSRGAMIAANFSAAITPLIRIVRSMSPRVTEAVRTITPGVLSELFAAEDRCQATPPRIMAPTRSAIQPDHLRGGLADGGNSFGVA
jgi:hypothetical protein